METQTSPQGDAEPAAAGQPQTLSEGFPLRAAALPLGYSADAHGKAEGRCPPRGQIASPGSEMRNEMRKR